MDKKQLEEEQSDSKSPYLARYVYTYEEFNFALDVHADIDIKTRSSALNYYVQINI